MRQRHPALVLLLCWLVFIALVVTADCALKPYPVTFTELPTPRPAMTVLPTVYVFSTTVPSPTVTPREMLPMLNVTRVPTRTFTPIPAPTRTPEPTVTPDKPAVQRGGRDAQAG